MWNLREPLWRGIPLSPHHLLICDIHVDSSYRYRFQEPKVESRGGGNNAAQRQSDKEREAQSIYSSCCFLPHLNWRTPWRVLPLLQYKLSPRQWLMTEPTPAHSYWFDV